MELAANSQPESLLLIVTNGRCPALSENCKVFTDFTTLRSSCRLGTFSLSFKTLIKDGDSHCQIFSLWCFLFQALLDWFYRGIRRTRLRRMEMICQMFLTWLTNRFRPLNSKPFPWSSHAKPDLSFVALLVPQGFWDQEMHVVVLVAAAAEIVVNQPQQVG